jgi:hypothetical protein
MLYKGDSMLYNCDKLCVCVTQIHWTCTPAFFGLAICHQIWKLQKWIDFGGFQSLEVREQNSRNCQVSIFSCFECVAKDIEGWLKFFINMWFIARFG